MSRANDLGSEYPGDTTDTLPDDPVNGRSEYDYGIRAQSVLVRPALNRSVTNEKITKQYNVSGVIRERLQDGYCYVDSYDVVSGNTSQYYAYLGSFPRYLKGDAVFLIPVKYGKAEWVVIAGPDPILYYKPPLETELADAAFQDNPEVDSDYYL